MDQQIVVVIGGSSGIGYEFGSVASASRFCHAFDEVRQFFRCRTTMKQKVSLVQQRDLFRQRLEALKALELVA